MTLLELQRDFRSWLHSEEDAAASRITARGHAGLSVYLNNYRGQLMACLAESYPVTKAWLGDAEFEAAAADHIDCQPPTSWTLDAYALGFPESLRNRYPQDCEVAELAQLECALAVAFVGPDAEPFDPSMLPDIDWDAAIIEFVPTLALLPATTNAGAIWSAINSGQTPPAAAMLPAPTSTAVWRSELVAGFRTLGPDEAEMLANGHSLDFAKLCAEQAERHGDDEGPARVGEALGTWLREGLVSAIRDRRRPAFR